MHQNFKPLATDKIDKQLLASGWLVQDQKTFNLSAGIGVAIREDQTSGGLELTCFTHYHDHKPRSRPVLTFQRLQTFKKQQLIVQEIESRLSVCDKIDETINNNLKRAETLRQGVLKKGFEEKLICL